MYKLCNDHDQDVNHIQGEDQLRESRSLTTDSTTGDDVRTQVSHRSPASLSLLHCRTVISYQLTSHYSLRFHFYFVLLTLHHLVHTEKPCLPNALQSQSRHLPRAPTSGAPRHGAAKPVPSSVQSDRLYLQGHDARTPQGPSRRQLRYHCYPSRSSRPSFANWTRLPTA